MTANLTENRGALGELELTCAWDKGMHDLLGQDRLIRLVRGEKWLWTLVITQRGGDSRSGITVTGRDPRFLLGKADDQGPMLVFREFIAGTTHLTNGDFRRTEYVIVNDEPILRAKLWTFAEGTSWKTTGTGGVTLDGTIIPEADDVLPADEKADAKPGQTWRATSSVAWLFPDASPRGKGRLRLIYEGHFDEAVVASPYATWGDSARTPTDITPLDADPGGLVPGPVFSCQSSMPNLVPDGEFDTGPLGPDYMVDFGTWGHGTDGGWNGPNYAYTDVSLVGSVLESTTHLMVVPGEEYELRTVIRANPGSPGTDGEAWMEVALADAGGPPYTRIGTDHLVGPLANTDWNIKRVQAVTIPDGFVSMTPLLNVANGTAGRFDFDSMTVIRTKGNIDYRRGPVFGVIPERTLKVRVNYRVDAGVTSGRVELQFVMLDALGQREELLVPGINLGPSDLAGLQTAEFEVAPPSGYDLLAPQIYSEDIVGGAIVVGQWRITDGDRNTRYYDAIGSEADSLLTVTVTAPEGTDRVGVALVAEEGAFSWLFGEAALFRVNEPIPTAAQVVDALLHDPVNGHYLLLPGRIYGDDTLLHDWLIEDTPLLSAIHHLSTSGLVSPLREDRVNPDMTYDWGTAEQLYTDRGALVLTDTSPIVRGGVAVETTNEDRVDRVVVIGAKKLDARGRPVQVRGSAENPVTVNDWQGQPVIRTKKVVEESIEIGQQADAFARRVLDRASTAIVNTRATLVNHERIDDFVVGDWVHPENRDAGLEDTTAAVDVEGETVFPAVQRVVHRQTHMGKDAGWRAEVLDPSSGQWVPVADVEWEDATTVDVELGTPLPDITVPV